MSRRPVQLLLADMMEAIERIESYTTTMAKENFSTDQKTADAVVRNLEIIGEAASRLPDAFKKKHHHIQWVKIIGLRNRIVHEYFGVDMQIVWQILKTDLPNFKGSLQKLFEP